MTTDGIYYRTMRLIPTRMTHPETAAVPDTLREGLVTAHAHRLHSNAQAATQVSIEPLDHRLDGPLIESTSPVGAGRWWVYVPSWVDRVVGEVVLAAAGVSNGLANVQLVGRDPTALGTALSGPVSNVPVDLSRGYATARASVPVTTLATATLDDDILVELHVSLTDDTQSAAIAMYPAAVSLWLEGV